MAEAKPTVVTVGTNKITGETNEHIYGQGSGVTLSYEGVPHIEAVEGGAEVAVKNKETGKDDVTFVKSGTVLNYEDEYFKHVVTIK